MFKRKLNLQMFGEGGDGFGSTGDSNATTGTDIATSEADKSGGEAIVYGKQNTDSTTESEGDSNTTEKSRASFEDLIKGEYKDDFQKKTQAIIEKRFKKTKGMEDTLKSHESIMQMLSDKYGVDSADVNALQKAIEDDDSFYEAEAFEKGLTVKQLKEVKALERENESFRRAQEEQEQRQHTEEIYSGWMNEWNALQQKYGLEGNFQDEVANEDFTRLLSNGISVEGAYKAVHMDEMLGGAMVRTANAVREGMANSISSRQNRPAENGISASQSSQVFKSDPSQLTKDDLVEIRKRVARGERISF